MRISHFETFKPVCPRCHVERQVIAPLTIANVELQIGDTIIEGNLICSDNNCRVEYPIIDGIPIILNNLRNYINDNFYHITSRTDLSSLSESILGDVAGPNSVFNNMRHYLSVYSWDHYGDQAPHDDANHSQQSQFSPGSIVNCLNTGLGLLKDTVQAPSLDIGCAVGRCTFETAQKHSGLALGIDLNFSLLRVAQRVLRDGEITYPLKRIGVVYDRKEYSVQFEAKERVDFWACDALALPFQPQTFAFVSALNVFDTVASPRNLLVSMKNMLKPGGGAVLATPYDWVPSTPMQNWVGGRSQRGVHQGAGEPPLRNMLSTEEHPQSIENFNLAGEVENHPWSVRIHSRHSSLYNVHIVACNKT